MVLIIVELSPELAKVKSQYQFEWKKWNIIKYKLIFTYKNGLKNFSVLKFLNWKT